MAAVMVAADKAGYSISVSAINVIPSDSLLDQHLDRTDAHESWEWWIDGKMKEEGESRWGD